MSDTKSLDDSAYWDERYQTKRNGWDNLGAHPFMPNVLAYLGGKTAQSLSVLVIGAGPGHDAEYLSGAIDDVLAIDFSEEAKKSFLKYYPQSSVRYECVDVFAPPSDFGKFDVIFEHTLLCAISPKRYQDYFDFIDKHLKAQGVYAGIIWNKTPVGMDGPPFSVPQDYVNLSLKKRDFKIHVESPVHPTIPGRANTETFVLAKKGL